jgi:hypothetical protein
LEILMSGDLSDTIETAAAGPARVQTDGTSVDQHSLPDLIEADKHLSNKRASARAHMGLRFTKIIPPGAG